MSDQRYLLTHEPHCGCRDKEPQLFTDTADITNYLWGRVVDKHRIYDGECPYHFHFGNLTVVEDVLLLYPLHRIRHMLPLELPLRALKAHGCWTGDTALDVIVCHIGIRP